MTKTQAPGAVKAAPQRFTYDAEADALGVTLAEGRAKRTQDLAPGVRLDWNAAGGPMFLEVLGASRFYPVEQLRTLASPGIELTLQQAAQHSGLNAKTLRNQILRGELEAKKVGRDWIVTLAQLETYLVNRAPSGRPARSRKARQARKATAAVG